MTWFGVVFQFNSISSPAKSKQDKGHLLENHDSEADTKTHRSSDEQGYEHLLEAELPSKVQTCWQKLAVFNFVVFTLSLLPITKHSNNGYESPFTKHQVKAVKLRL